MPCYMPTFLPARVLTQVIINGRYRLDETEQLRLKVQAIIDAAAAQRAARPQSSEDAPPKMWRDGARYNFSHKIDFVANERAAAGLTRRGIAGKAAQQEHLAVATTVESEARRQVQALEGWEPAAFEVDQRDYLAAMRDMLLLEALEVLHTAIQEREFRSVDSRGGVLPTPHPHTTRCVLTRLALHPHAHCPTPTHQATLRASRRPPRPWVADSG